MISISHLGVDYFLGCMNIVVHQTAYKYPEHPLGLRNAGWTPDYSHQLHAMGLLRVFVVFVQITT